jgi:DNA (cytosine-5)-methyltransferase 1
MGYHYAGFDVIGVDTKPQPQYPFPILRRDGLAALTDDDLLSEIDAIHASPPCHSETFLRHRTGKTYRDLLTPTLKLLDDLVDIPWVVENVETTTKMPQSIVLCGTHFNLGTDNRVLRRHRRFSASFTVRPPGPCWCSGQRVGGVYGSLTRAVSTRGYKFPPDDARKAMRIDWMSSKGLSLAIPPDYTRWVGEQLMTHLAQPVPARDHLRERYSSGRIDRFAKL